MASFTARVELHDATYSDYDTLHKAMEAEGFSRLIKSDGGVLYHLPTAEYNRVTDLTRAQVLDSAKRAATRTRKAFAVLVTESAGRTWDGLQEVKAASVR